MPAHDEVAASIPIIRERTGDPSVPIHIIGGIADASSGPETRGFVRSAREHGVLGASLYNWSLTRDHHWTELRQVPVNQPQARRCRRRCPSPMRWATSRVATGLMPRRSSSRPAPCSGAGSSHSRCSGRPPEPCRSW
jgi:hypothetical protein